MNNFIDSLNLPFQGEMRGSQYFIDLDSSNDFAKLFDSIALNDLLRLEDGSVANVEESNFRYTDGVYDVLLKADYINNIYSLLIEER